MKKSHTIQPKVFVQYLTMADFQSYIILFLVWFVSTILVRAIFTKTRTKLRLPPSPLALPIIGHLHLLGPIPHQAFQKLSNRYGPLIHLYLGSVPCVVASTPEVAKEFLKTQETSFLNRPQMTAVDYLTYGSADFSFTPYGPYWKFMKKICMTQLLGGRTLDQFLPLRREEIKKFLHLMLKKADRKESVEVEGELMKLSNNVISRMLMGKTCSENDNEAEEIRKLITETAELTGKFNLKDYIWFCKNLDLQGFGKRLKKVRDKFDSMMDQIIQEHEEARMKENYGDTVKDLLDMLLDISEDKSSEFKLTRENIKAFILDIFAAGSDTSALTIAWALSELVNNPNIMKKAREEMDTIVGQTRLVEESDIGNLPYLQAIVKETLRLHPTGPMAVRESTERCTINGYDIPEKTQLFVNLWAIGRDAKHWETPLEFKPERFLSEDESGNINQLDVRGQNYHFMPFGSGRRGCPGTSLAMLVVQATLAAMIQCFEWRVDGFVDMEEGSGLTLPRANPLVCLPVARLTSLPS
ncbi:cytochrome P450 93A3-like [Humulus lupulus]|uniref:cytochrome P450 93A3-like n=1 Tax=Humulus lupulus TaxID=3486 RepID=UPI002B40918F|nr:cytochrome P450 93A3-like [Humulus lupulus]